MQLGFVKYCYIMTTLSGQVQASTLFIYHFTRRHVASSLLTCISRLQIAVSSMLTWKRQRRALDSTDRQTIKATGSDFKAIGPATENTRQPSLQRWSCTMISW